MSQQRISSFLSRSVLQIRVALFFRALFVSYTCLAISVLSIYALDRLLDLRTVTREILSVSLIVFSLFLLYWMLLKPLFKSYSNSDIALIAERTFGMFNGALITVVEITDTSEILSLLKRQVVEQIDKLPSLPLLNLKRISKNLAVFVLFVACLLTFVFGFPQEASTFYKRMQGAKIAYPVVSAFEVALEDETRVPMGESIQVQVTVINGFEFNQVLLKVVGDEKDIIVMKKTQPNTFIAEVAEITRNLEIQVSAKGKKSKVFKITCVPRPSLTKFQVTVISPEFSGKKPFQLLEGQGNLKVLPQSRIEINIQSNKKLKASYIILNGETTIPMEITGRRASGSFIAKSAGKYTLSLVDMEDIVSKGMPIFSVRMLKDKKPLISFERPSANEKVTPNGAFRLKCELKDDYGIGKCVMYLEVLGTGAKLSRIQIPIGNNLKEISINRVIEIENMKFSPGTSFIVRLEVSDNNPEPNVTTTDGIQIRVVRAYEMLEDLHNFISSLKIELKLAIEFEDFVSVEVRKDKCEFRTILVRHRQKLRSLSGVVEDLMNIADRFRLNKLGDEESDFLEEIAGGISTAVNESGKALSTSLVVLSGIAQLEKKDEVIRASKIAELFSESLKLQLKLLDKFENFGEVIRDLKGLISKQEELRILLKRLIERKFGE